MVQCDDEELPRKLRPRKVGNYKDMLEGDEVTKKIIQEEQEEVKRKRKAAKEDNDDFDMDSYGAEEGPEVEVEAASDDEEYHEASPGRSSAKRKCGKVVDEDASEEDVASADDEGVEDALNDAAAETQKKRAKKMALKLEKADSKTRKTKREAEEDEQDFDQHVYIDNLPNNDHEIQSMLRQVRKHIKALERQFFEEEDSEKEEELKQISNTKSHDEALAAFKETSHMKQFWCIPLSVDVIHFEFTRLADAQQRHGGRLFDVITIDPPWQLSSANPTRGVAIAYDTLNDKQILDMPFNVIQKDGFLFIWVINAKYRFALELFEKFGYALVDEISWVKQTVNGKIAKGHGYYLQHAKETCLVGVKGDVSDKARFNIESDVIFSMRRGQSQKPEEIYEIAEALVPNGYYLEIFGRRNNLHNGWVTVGNEL